MSRTKGWTREDVIRAQLKTGTCHLGETDFEKPKVNKYRNKIIEAHGRRFDSKKESGRFLELNMMERAGIITNLECQKRFILRANGQIICSYISDFSYFKDGKEITEDVKSAYTRKLPVYRLKKKLMQILLGIEVIEV